MKPGTSLAIEVPTGGTGLKLPGILTKPEVCYGLILFAHGSGSSRFSKRKQFVADALKME